MGEKTTIAQAHSFTMHQIAGSIPPEKCNRHRGDSPRPKGHGFGKSTRGAETSGWLGDGMNDQARLLAAMKLQLDRH